MLYLYLALIFALIVLIGVFNFKHTLRSAGRLLRDLADHL